MLRKVFNNELCEVYDTESLKTWSGMACFIKFQ